MLNLKFNLNKCKIIKELGQGMVGITYLVELDSIQYALKIEKIPESHISKQLNTKYPEWREIKFSEQFGNKYPEQFIKLNAWDIIDNCDYVNPNDFSHLPEEAQKRLQDKIDSKLCIRKLYSLVDTDLSKIIKTLRFLTRLIKYEKMLNNKLFKTNKLLGIKDLGTDLGTDLMNMIKQTTEWENLDQYIIDSNPDDKIILFQILYPDIFQQILLGNKFEKVIKLIYLIDNEDIIYFMKNKSNLKKIIKYFVCKIYDIEIDEIE